MSSSPAPTATSAAAWCPNCSPAATTSAAWCAIPRAWRGAPGPRGWTSHAATCSAPASLPAALAGIDVAYYLVHSLGAGRDFHDQDVRAARSFGEAAAAAGVARIIYLGGLGDSAAALSEHLRSRQETGTALQEAGVPVTEFRAAVIVGSGSVSFEMIRYLTERVPVMICPSWVYTRIQPIAIRDVLHYLADALDTPESAGQIVEIGGSDVMTYGQMMTRYAELRGLRRWLVPVPVLTPRLSSYWVHLVTPIPAAIAGPLIEGLRNEVVVRDTRARRLFPRIEPVSYAEAVRRALANFDGDNVETRVVRCAHVEPARPPSRWCSPRRKAW